MFRGVSWLGWCWALGFSAVLTLRIRGGEQRGGGRRLLGWHTASCADTLLLPREQTWVKNPCRSWTRRISKLLKRAQNSTHTCTNRKHINIYRVLLKSSLEAASEFGPLMCYFPRQMEDRVAVGGWPGQVGLSCISSSGYRGLVPAEFAWLVWEQPEKKRQASILPTAFTCFRFYITASDGCWSARLSQTSEPEGSTQENHTEKPPNHPTQLNFLTLVYFLFREFWMYLYVKVMWYGKEHVLLAPPDGWRMNCRDSCFWLYDGTQWFDSE